MAVSDGPITPGYGFSMSETGISILRKKIDSGVRDEGPVDLVKPVPESFAAAIAPAFTEFYGEKCELKSKDQARFVRMGRALAPFDARSAIYHFRLNGEDDLFVILDMDAAMMAAGWSLSATREKPETMPDEVGAIDRRLAKSLAKPAAETIFAKPALCGATNGVLELIASGADPRRFDLVNETQRSVMFTLAAQTIENEMLGGVTLIASENVIASVREHNRQEKAAAEAKWKQGLLRLASWSTVEMRTVLARQDVDISRLMSMQAGDVINLPTATIDAIVFAPAQHSKSRLRMTGALGNRDGARALKITSITV